MAAADPIKPGDMVMVVVAPRHRPEMLGAVGTCLAVNPAMRNPYSGRVAPLARVRFPTGFKNQVGKPVPIGWLRTHRLQKLRPPAPPPKEVPVARPILEGVPA